MSVAVEKAGASCPGRRVPGWLVFPEHWPGPPQGAMAEDICPRCVAPDGFGG